MFNIFAVLYRRYYTTCSYCRDADALDFRLNPTQFEKVLQNTSHIHTYCGAMSRFALSWHLASSLRVVS
jgi:hypothetical protein